MQTLFVKFQWRSGALAFAAGSAVPGEPRKIYDYRPMAD
jgi:hypothetical protein